MGAMRRRRVWLIVLLSLALIGAAFVPLLLQLRQERLNKLLIQALKDRNVQAVAVLLDQGADADSEESLYSTSPRATLKDRVVDLLESLQRRQKAIPVRLFRRPALVVACVPWDAKSSQMIALLVNHGARPNTLDRSLLAWTLMYTDDWDPRPGTPLCVLSYAVEHNDLSTVDLLLRHRADPNRRDPNGSFPLVWASADCARLLIDAGAEVDAKIWRGATVLLRAVQRRDVPLIQVLLERKADINARDDDGKTPLMYGCIQLSPPFTRYLLQHGADVNAQDGAGRTPLMLAVESSEPPEQIRVLLQYGAKVQIKDRSGRTVLDYGRRRGEPEITGLLEAAARRERRARPPARR